MRSKFLSVVVFSSKSQAEILSKDTALDKGKIFELRKKDLKFAKKECKSKR